MRSQREEKEKPVVTHDEAGKLTRAGALIEARKKLGEMASLYVDALGRCVVWVIGDFRRTVGRGKTWEQAIERSKRSEATDAKLT